MIINPPFLPDSNASVTQSDVDAMMLGGQHGRGAFPVSLNGWWHGGMHLESGGKHVYAIADGKVHYLRKPTPKPDSPDRDNPLYYNGGWTSDGVIVIKHQTEIGENIKLTWYSVYMHLREVGKHIAQGKPVWRKDELGDAGWIYGRKDLIHFEIAMDAANVAALIGRQPDTPLDTGKPGRTDAVWGASYVHLPAGTKVYTEDMREAQRAAHSSTTAQTTYAALQDGGKPLGTEVVVGIDYHQGACTLTSYHPQDGICGAAISEAGDYEYGLYDEATALYPDGAEAGYELLRFGRVLNAAHLPKDTAHWRKITLPDGTTGWVNLNAAGAAASSDADFPPWCGWVFADDDTDGNIRCNSEKIKSLVLTEHGQRLPDDQFIPRLKLDAVRKKLAHAICKMPSDWDESRREQIWQQWQHAQGLEFGYVPPQEKAAAEKGWQRLKAHFDALCFWNKAGLPEPAWHLPPKAFIKQMQRCGWLSQDEMVQLFPPTAMRPVGHGQWVSDNLGHSSNIAKRIAPYQVDLNKMCRLYGIVTPQRIAAFYANAEEETMWFGTLVEGIPKERRTVNGHVEWIPVPPRYNPWIGRGFLQLTWPDNYVKYWKFAGKTLDAVLVHDLQHAQEQVNYRHKHHLPDQGQPLAEVEARVRTSPMNDLRQAVSVVGDGGTAADSAGAYWAWSGAAKYADQLSPNVRTAKQVDRHPCPYYKNTTFGKVAATINVGSPSTNFEHVNGIVARFQAYAACQMVLFDVTAFPSAQQDIHLTPDDYRQRRP